MNKTALALAIPVALIGAGIAGAWYTGTQVESYVDSTLAHANAEIPKAAPGAGIEMSLLSVKRGLFASQARYQLSFTDEDGGKPRTLEFSDRLEHGPFPLSRLAKGKLAPVMAQSNFVLDRSPVTEALFMAAGGKAPLTGEAAIAYDGGTAGELTLAALAFHEKDASLRLSPLHATFEVSGDYRTNRMNASLAELSLVGAEPESGTLVRIEAHDVAMQADKSVNDAGFAVGPGSFTAGRVKVQAEKGTVVTLNQMAMEEALTQNGAHLDQTVTYRIGTIDVQHQPVGGLSLKLSARHLDHAALKELFDTYNRIVFAGTADGEVFDGDLTPVQQEMLKTQVLRLLQGQPSLALDELSLKTASGEASLSVAADLRQPNEDASLDASMGSALAALTATLKVDKPLIGDLATLQARLSDDSNEPAVLAQQSAAANELFSGVALNSGWAQLQGSTLTSSLNYANDRVNFNGQDMSVEEFMEFVMGSIGGMAGL